MNKDFAESLLPPPFAWCDVPSGQVTIEGVGHSYVPLGQYETFDVPAFRMAKYPITNAQYDAYVQATGNAPRYWHELEWDDADLPVSGVSWHDALDYCAWLSGQVGYEITLPTEQQWQRAAQGDDRRIYPWGNTIDETYANYENTIGVPTPVTDYKYKNVSPYGVVDMVGNVWEWCLTDWDSGANDTHKSGGRSVLRGGAYVFVSFDLRCTTRGNDLDLNWGNAIGFRVVCNLR